MELVFNAITSIDNMNVIMASVENKCINHCIGNTSAQKPLPEITRLNVMRKPIFCIAANNDDPAPICGASADQNVVFSPSRLYMISRSMCFC